MTYNQMLEDPMEVIQNVCEFLGVHASEKLPPQPFSKQTSGDTRSALDADSLDALWNAFKHTDRACDFEGAGVVAM